MSMLLMAAIALPVSAQQWPDAPGASSRPDQDSPAPKAKAKAKKKVVSPEATDELTPAQIRRAQEQGPPPGPADDMPKAVKRAPSKGPPAAREVTCRGPFGADSGHVRLTQVFGLPNVVVAEVDGPGGSKLPASVLFPKDPKRRLEVLWKNNSTRVGLQVVAINGQSAWTAPRGLKVGMPIAAVEKINGKAFKITGFGAEGSSTADWQGGALLNLPGGCKVAARFIMDGRAPADARQRMSASQELDSSDPGVRAVRPTVAEILIGY
jgi:hypothetical protein